jgi:hypothetical protein
MLRERVALQVLFVRKYLGSIISRGVALIRCARARHDFADAIALHRFGRRESDRDGDLRRGP